MLCFHCGKDATYFFNPTPVGQQEITSVEGECICETCRDEHYVPNPVQFTRKIKLLKKLKRI